MQSERDHESGMTRSLALVGVVTVITFVPFLFEPTRWFGADITIWFGAVAMVVTAVWGFTLLVKE